MTRICGLLLTSSVTLALALAPAAAQTPLAGSRIPGGCDVPLAERTAEIGCYLVATTPVGALPATPQYWHLYKYATRADADAAAGERSTVAESLGSIWVYTIAAHEWRPASGERVAVLGPLTVEPDIHYTARYMEAVFPRGMQTSAHHHSGAEAWFVVAGAQCLETPDDVIVVKAREGAVVPSGPPMALSTVGSEMRRSVLIVLHDSSKPWMTVTTEWTPQGRCPK